MGKVIFSISMSVDGFITGPDVRPGQELGKGGDVLHRWLFHPAEADRKVLEAGLASMGAHIVGRRMFDLAQAWDGRPPGAVQCFVLTHEPPAEWVKPGSPFTFVTDGIESAIAQATVTAAGKNVLIGGGANVIQQAMRAGLVDEIALQLVPVLLGAGTPLFDDLAPARLEPIAVVESPNATHLGYRVVHT